MYHVLPFKIGRVSFRPAENSLSAPSHREVLVSSAMEEGQNQLELLTYKQNQITALAKRDIASQIADLKWINSTTVVAGDNAGNVHYVRISSGAIELVETWPKLKRPVTGVTVMNFNEIAAGVTSESGQICLFGLSGREYLRQYHDDCAVLSCVSLTPSTIGTGNLFGQVKWWDARTAEAQAERTFDIGEPGVGVNALAQHPGRSSLVLGGTTDGNIHIWDTRKDKLPLTTIHSHDALVHDLKFHTHRPVALSCGEDGKLFAYGGEWDGTPQISEHDMTPAKLKETINSLDVCDDYIVSGGDNGVLCVTQFD